MTAMKWSEAEMSTLRRLYPGGGATAVLEALVNRSRKAIYRQAHKMHLETANCYTPQDDEILRRDYPMLGAGPIAARLRRTAHSVQQRAWRLGIAVETKRISKPTKETRHKIHLTQLPGKGKLLGYAIVNSETKVTIAEPFVDRRFAPDGPVQRVVDSADCRDWARSATP